MAVLGPAGMCLGARTMDFILVAVLLFSGFSDFHMVGLVGVSVCSLVLLGFRNQKLMS